MKNKCSNCNIALKKTSVKYKEIEFEAMQCPKCREKIFTEDMAMRAINKLESERLKSEYIKRPIKIGHSWGIIFPKEISDVFELNRINTKLKLHPDLEKGKIEISLR